MGHVPPAVPACQSTLVYSSDCLDKINKTKQISQNKRTYVHAAGVLACSHADLQRTTQQKINKTTKQINKQANERTNEHAARVLARTQTCNEQHNNKKQTTQQNK